VEQAWRILVEPVADPDLAIGNLLQTEVVECPLAVDPIQTFPFSGQPGSQVWGDRNALSEDLGSKVLKGKQAEQE
jgi:hypothetical protein